MRVLVGCEFSGIVRDAFITRGHKAVSCDLLASERGWPHIRGDLFTVLGRGWDLMIFHWPCTNMCVSGARWWPTKRDAQQQDIEAFIQLMECNRIPRVAGENPIGILSTAYRKPDQIIQPWQFGHGEIKATCLWLRNLPLLVPTNIVEGRVPRVHHASPGPNRWKERSRTLLGIADAMAAQWGIL